MTEVNRYSLAREAMETDNRVEKLKALATQLAEALEYHQEQTRPIHGTIVALAVYRGMMEKERQ
jgi:hypothetical protein